MSAIVSHATGALPHLRLRAFHRRSSLPSLCYRIAANSVAAHATPAANDYDRGGGVKRSRLLDLLSLTKGAERPNQSSIGERGELVLSLRMERLGKAT
jgi:hypothetical protein